MSADFVSGRRDGQARRVDWLGCGALAVGLTVALVGDTQLTIR
jgi:hypothetical protein